MIDVRPSALTNSPQPARKEAPFCIRKETHSSHSTHIS